MKCGLTFYKIPIMSSKGTKIRGLNAKVLTGDLFGNTKNEQEMNV